MSGAVVCPRRKEVLPCVGRGRAFPSRRRLLVGGVTAFLAVFVGLCPCLAFPSGKPGNAGASQSSLDAIETVNVPAGAFTMGKRDDGDDATHGSSDELPRHQVTLSAYQIGK